MPPTIILSHYIFAAIIGLCAVAVYRKSQKTDISMLDSFWKFFAVWAGLFFFPLAGLLHLGVALENPALLSAAYVVPHLFAFTAVGYLWKTLTAFNFPEYESFFWAFVIYGAGIVAYGLYEMPEVVQENGALLLGPESTFSMLIPVGMAVAGVLIAASSFYSALQLEGESRIKLGLLGIGTLIALIVAGSFHNAGMHKLGDLSNIVWISLFFLVAYWQEIKDRFPV